MSRFLKLTFLVHAVVSLLLGAALLIKPGGFLEWVGWYPIDPIISRVLGAGLLALAWSSFRGWQAHEWKQVAILVEMEAAFTVLGCVGMLRHLLFGKYLPVAWVAVGVLAVFAAIWIASWFRKT